MKKKRKKLTLERETLRVMEKSLVSKVPGGTDVIVSNESIWECNSQFECETQVCPPTNLTCMVCSYRCDPC